MPTPTLAHAGNQALGGQFAATPTVTSQQWNHNINEVCASGEDIYIVVMSRETVTAAPAGFTLKQSGTQGSMHWYLYHKVAGGSEPGSYSFTMSNATTRTSLAMYSVAGSQGITEGTVGTATSATATAPSITIPSTGGLLTGVWGGFDGTGNTGWSFPAGFSSIINASFVAAGGFAYDAATGYKTNPATGATGTVSSTNVDGTDNLGVLIFFAGTPQGGWLLGGQSASPTFPTGWHVGRQGGF